MKNLLIIYPHWPPSNLAGVHRPRLIANFIGEFGWKPIVLTVAPEYYEEEPDWDIIKTVSGDVEVLYTRAFKSTKPRVLGDIGLRAFPFLYKAALKLISEKKIDFIWIPIPSFYTSLLGRAISAKTSVPYGIDYIDPWVRDISNRSNLRARLSLIVAKWLEPVAVKNAALISGVSEAYYTPVLERNFRREVAHVGMPYGFDPNDHKVKIDGLKLPWAKMAGCEPVVYAGAFLPNSHLFIKALFAAIGQKVKDGSWDDTKKLFFLGTGNYTGISITDYAAQYGIASVVIEIRKRFPFLHILNFLSEAFAVMVIGSTEKHYTASKTFQALLSNKPVFGIMHEESSAAEIMKECKGDNYLVLYNGHDTVEQLRDKVISKLDSLVANRYWLPDLIALEKYTARASAKALSDKLSEIV